MRTLSELPRKQTLLLLRGALTVTVGALALTTLPGPNQFNAHGLLGAFLISMVGLFLLPEEYFKTSRLELGVVLLDTLFLVAFVYYSSASSPGVLLSFFAVILLAALSGDLKRGVAAATVATILYAAFSASTHNVLTAGFLVRVPFLYVVALYYGYFVGLTMERQQQAKRTVRERDHLRAVLDVMEATTSSLDIQSVFVDVTKRISRHLGATRCSVLLINEKEHPDHAFVLASSDDANVDMLRLHLSRYPEVQRAVAMRKPVIIDDILADPAMQDVVDQIRHLGFRSMLVLPMTQADVVVGAMLIRAAKRSAFQAAAVQFGMVVSGATTNAVNNALLYREAHRKGLQERQISEKLKHILDGSPDLILSTDADGVVTEFNHGGQKILGHRREDILGKSLSSIFQRNQEFSTLWGQAVQGGPAGQMSASLRHADGSCREVSFSCSALLDPGGETAGLVAVGRDMTELKKGQEQLQLAYRLSTMGEVISGVAHELNNPLSAVVGYSQLLMEKEPGGDNDVRMLRSIYDSAWRCQRIVQNLVSFGSKHQSEKRHVSLNAVLEKVIELKAYQLMADGITLDKEFDSRLPATMMDSHRMEQVFVNLINNAHHALMQIPKGRRIVVRTRTSEGRVFAEIVDNGPGIPGEIRNKLFEPFFSTKRPEDGIGLGLSVSYGIVHSHEGTLSLSSAPGLGAVFTVELPIIDGEDENVDAEERKLLDCSSIPPGTRILVVDDEPLILDLFTDLLDAFPCRVDTARNGMEAMRKVLDGYYDLVISDLKMPEVDGPTFFREIIKKRPEMVRRIVFTTGDVASRATSEFLAEANLPVIQKPIDIREAAAVIIQATMGAPVA